MTTNYTYIADLAAQEAQDMKPDSTVSRTIYNDDHIKAVLFSFAAGQELTEHTASQPAILYFLKGETELTLGDDKVAAKTGTWIHMPPHLPHSLSAKDPVVMLLMLIKTG